MNGIQSQDDIVMLQFVNEHGDRVELVILIRFHGGRSVSGDESDSGRSERGAVEASGDEDVEREIGVGFPLPSGEFLIVGWQSSSAGGVDVPAVGEEAKRGSGHRRRQRWRR
jgi:hypothetical protein